MIINRQRRDPRHADDGGEMRKIDIVAKKRRETDRETGKYRGQRDPARKNPRHEKQQDRTGERDVNRPGDHRPLRVRYRGDCSRT